MIKELGQTIAGVKHEQEYMQVKKNLKSNAVILPSVGQKYIYINTDNDSIFWMQGCFEL